MSRTTRKYSHSPYFAAKKAVAKKISELGGLSVGAFPSVERRVASLGQVYLPRTAEFLSYRQQTDKYRHPSRSRYSIDTAAELGGFSGAIGISLAMDIGEAIVRDVKTLADPRAREILKRELLRNLRILRRPWYYANETKRRRALAAERRKVRRSTTTAPCPTPEMLLAAWNARKDSTEAMIRLGSLLRDLSCYVDSALRFDESGSVVGRNGGIRGWLKENLPELSAKYKTLMRYKAMDKKLRQATGTHDPTPTYAVYVRAKDPEGTREGRSASRKRGVKGVGEINENSMRKILEAAGRGVKRVGNGGEMVRERERIGDRGRLHERGEKRISNVRGKKRVSNESGGMRISNERGGKGIRYERGGKRVSNESGEKRISNERGRMGIGRSAGSGGRESFAALTRAIDLSVRAERVGYC